MNLAEKMTAASSDYAKLVDEFRQKINSIPGVIEKVNDKLDFSSGRYQEIMIDIEGCITTLADDFFLFAESAEGLLSKWTSVETDLPDRKVLASFVNCCGKRRTIVASYVHPRTETVEDAYSSEHWGVVEVDHDEENDIEWRVAGWVEHIENWEDLTHVDVSDKITHWMPLPGAPK